MAVLAPIFEEGPNPGTPVSALVSRGPTSTLDSDADVGASHGIAIVAADNTHGSWQFSIDEGQHWKPLGSPSEAAAQLLAAEPSALVRFVPQAGFHGQIAGLKFRAWDRTSGESGQVADATVRGGSTAFSSETATASINIMPASGVRGRYVFYNNSKFDGINAGVGAADDDAIAIDKLPLLPGETASFSNYTSYVRGLNGVMIDVAGLGGALTQSDFEFRVGNSNTPAQWSLLATPPSISVRPAREPEAPIA